MDLTEFNSLDREAAVAAVGPALDVQRWIEDYRRQWEARLDRLEIFLRKQQEAADGKVN